MNQSQTGGASSAIAWAESFESGHANADLSSVYNGYCLEFVGNAYGTDQTALTAWDLALELQLNDPHDPSAAPVGSLMFFDLTNHGISNGHVGISLGGGAMISALEHAPVVQITAIVQSDAYWWNDYRGWAWPPASWGPLAKQAASPASDNGGGVKVAVPSVELEEAFVIRFTPTYVINLSGFPANASISVTCYDSQRPAGFKTFTMQTDKAGNAEDGETCQVLGTGIDHWVVAGGVSSNHFTDTNVDDWETAGSAAHTWTDYLHAGGTQGLSVASLQTIQVACKVMGFKVADGNPWWYQIASAPWNSAYYASADAFYNNGQTSGSLHGTPWVDTSVSTCTQSPIQQPTPVPTHAPPPPTPTPVQHSPTVTPATPTPVPPTVTHTPVPVTYWETSGSIVHTWTNYANAGGNEGPSVSAYATIQIACKLTGFKVADGNTWWYRIAQSPWSNQYYASADAFYNNGQTSGSLQGTPFVDPNVPNC